MSYYSVREKEVKTRKPHQCIGCLETYPKGSLLLYRAYVFDGEFQTDYLCDNCVKALGDMDSSDMEDGFMAGDLRQGWVNEQGDSI